MTKRKHTSGSEPSGSEKKSKQDQKKPENDADALTRQLRAVRLNKDLKWRLARASEKALASYPVEVLRRVRSINEQQKALLHRMTAAIEKNRHNDRSIRQIKQVYRDLDAEKAKLLRARMYG